MEIEKTETTEEASELGGRSLDFLWSAGEAYESRVIETERQAMQRVYREVHRIADLRGWGHSTSADVRDVVERLKDELGDIHRVF